jgi:sulfite reductase alpha subunit-like flavoprotein
MMCLMLQAAGKELVDILCRDESLFYVCGDGAHMAKDVRKTIVEMLETHLELDTKAATEIVVKWERKGKYLQDIWS